ncbi:MAG: aromatic ring-hydroxylating dioxygenase subunit alpha [Myxococcales bacterium]|nr:aromatic ring-hydroxylating dioxygenase subunit alpha [Myxococcales bacterium]
MRNASLRDLVFRFDPEVPIERAWMPPGAWYTDPDLYALERRAVFGASWQAVARVEQLGVPGAYLSGCLTGMPWVIVRADNGKLAAYHNVCRHKGREVVRGHGVLGELVCGYHAWSYSLDGRLRSAPRVGGIQDFDREEMSLTPILVETWGRWVFINIDLAAEPLAVALSGLAQRMSGRDWLGYRFLQSTEWVIQSNWKAVVDNYLDGGYHIPHMHPTLAAQLDMADYRTEVFGSYSIQSAAASRAADERIAYSATARIGDGAMYAWLYPNFMVNLYGNCIDTNTVIPLGHDRCKVVYDFYFRESAGEAGELEAQDSIAQSAVTQREDIEICESIQRGNSSPSFDRGRYAPNVEQGEHHFHRLLAAQLRRALG